MWWKVKFVFKRMHICRAQIEAVHTHSHTAASSAHAVHMIAPTQRHVHTGKHIHICTIWMHTCTQTYTHKRAHT